MQNVDIGDSDIVSHIVRELVEMHRIFAAKDDAT
jgi:hypothetical protein